MHGGDTVLMATKQHTQSDPPAQSRLERWAPGGLRQIDADMNQARAKIADPTTGSAHLLWHALEIEVLCAQEALVRLLVADREVGVASMYYDLHQSRSGSMADRQRANAKSDAVLWFLSKYGHMLTDQEVRRATCGPTAAPYCGA